MIKLFISFALIFNVITGFSQKAIKSIEPYKALTGHVFRVGDTLRLAKASMPDRSFKCGTLVPTKASYAMAGVTGGPLGTDFENKDFIIDHFVTYKVMGMPTIYAYFSIKNKVLHGEIAIDCAIAEGELIP